MEASKQLKIWSISLLVFILLLYVLHDVLTPFVAGMAVAYFIDPIADKLEKWGLSRTTATSVITVGFFIIMIGALSLLLPVLTSQVIGFAGRVPTYFDHLHGLLKPVVQQVFSGASEADLKELGATAASFAKQAFSVVGNLLQRLISGGAALFDVVSILVLTPLVTFYLLRDWDLLVARIDHWLPRKHAPVIREQFSLIDETLAGFVRGQASVCLMLGSFYAIGLSVLGLEFGLLVGLGAGLISFIPYFGSILGFGVSISIALVQFDDLTQVGLVAGVFAIGQILEGNVLTPKLVGEKVGLHPVWVIFALMAGGALAGFTGVMLAVPVAAIIGVLVRFGLAQYMKSALYTGTPSNKA
ncbi:putative permease [Candidatus Terasakiella magnetica]|uniref:Putative permease n=1 Tax=Candidatus Terasakiella magnetica TaxID=1867952 RepID=A0A1C3RK21_9PROT|nr:AI-2E family transporter [Candidatus Terasakiella magnetica]SCA57634.1 putative permease [Candidatus Terasakiella magnetica]